MLFYDVNTYSPTCQIPDINNKYLELFGQKFSGSFIDIGSYTGLDMSNVSFLAPLGWEGHCIEPVEPFFNECVNNFKAFSNIHVHNFAIGSSNKKVPITIDGPFSSCIPLHINALGTIRRVTSKTTCNVNQITLNAFLKRNNIKPGFDLLNIDVEGSEWPILSVFDFDKWVPKVVIVELRDIDSTFIPYPDIIAESKKH